MEKNVAGKWVVFAYGLPSHASAGQAITGDAANITANIRIDGAAANAVDDTNPTELEDGYYIFDITAAEANGEHLVLCPASSTANVQVIGVPGAVWTRPANFSDANLTASGNIGIDWANVENPATAVDLSGTDIQLVDTCTTNTDMTTGDDGSLATGTAAAIAAGTITLASGHGITDTTVLVALDGGTNAVGKSRTATYSGAGDVFNVDPDWDATINGNAETTPSGTITYKVYPMPAAGSAYPADVNVLTIESVDATDQINAACDTAISDAALATAAALTTAQNDLDTITGADGAALASTQQSITFQPIIITAGDAVDNLTFAGTGSADGIAFTRSGAGDPFDTNFMAQINTEVDTALTDYDAATGTELAATEAKIDTIDGIVDAILALLDDPRAEPGQGAPAVNADAMTKLDYLYKAFRNKSTQTATTYELYDDAGTTVDQKATVSDDGTTATKAEIVTGP